MALDFKSMSTEKKIALCGAAVAALFSFVAFIIALTPPATQEGILKAFFSSKGGNPFGGYNWVTVLLFIASLGFAAIMYVKAAPSKLIPAIPFKLVTPAVVALTGLFAMLYLHIGKETGGFLAEKGTAWGVFLLIFVIAEIAIFALNVFEKKDNIKDALADIIFLVAAVLLFILTIIALATPDGSLVGYKLFLIFYTIACLCYAGFVCFKEIKE